MALSYRASPFERTRPTCVQWLACITLFGQKVRPTSHSDSEQTFDP